MLRSRRHRRVSKLRRFRCLAIERCETRALLATIGAIELGPSDNIALDQPRVAFELATDTDPGPGEEWTSVGPTVFNTLLLDTGANSVLTMATAVEDMTANTGLYFTQGEFVEQGVAGGHPLDISIPYRVDFAGTSGERHTLDNARILSDSSNDFSMFGPWGIVGMPAMVNRVTSLDMRGWSGGGLGLEDLYMKVAFSGDVPPEETAPGVSHRYSVPVDNRISFDPLDQLLSGDPPVWADVPWMTAIPKHRDIAQEGNFLFDTGAQISVISKHLAKSIGLDSNGDGELDERDESYVTSETVGGIGGQVSVPIFAIDEVRLPAQQVSSGADVELVWTDLQWLVLDIPTPEGQPSLDGVFGSDLITSGWFHAFFAGQSDGYIDQVHFDFREMDNGSGTLYFDLNPSVDKLVEPGPGVRIRQTVRITEAVEGGDTDVYSIQLLTVPTSPVEIEVLADDQTEVSADGGVTFKSKLKLTFTNGTPQAVTVRAIDDQVLEGNHTGVITHKVTNADPDYNNKEVAEVEVQITDNDLQLLKITSDAQGQNAITSIAVNEGATVHYWVTLLEPPTSETWVLIEDTKGQVEPVNPNNQLGDPSFNNLIIFNSANWDEPQQIDLTAVDDTLKEGLHHAQLVHTLLDISNFLDPIIGQNNLTVDITDNDLGGVTIANGAVAISEGGPSGTYQIALTNAPSGPVQITVTAGSQAEISTDGGATFATSGVLTVADTASRTVTVRAIDDAIHEGPHNTTIAHQVTGTIVDPRYPANLAIADATVDITDNDPVGLQIVVAGGTASVEEGSPATRYSVVLISQPTEDVTVFLSESTGQVLAVDDQHPSSSSLKFTPANWNVAQDVRATAVDDDSVEAPFNGHLTHKVFSADRDYHGEFLLPVRVDDNDSLRLVLNITASSIGENSGAAATKVTVSRGTTQTSTSLLVVLSNGDTSELQIPASVTIPAGESSAEFAIDAVDDVLVDGTQTVAITATAAGYTKGEATVEVTDYETWHNEHNKNDVNGDNSTGPQDVLVIVNELNGRKYSTATGKLQATYAAGAFRYDVNGDGFCTAIDALVIVNFLNARINPENEGAWEEKEVPEESIELTSSQPLALPVPATTEFPAFANRQPLSERVPNSRNATRAADFPPARSVSLSEAALALPAQRRERWLASLEEALDEMTR